MSDLAEGTEEANPLADAEDEDDSPAAKPDQTITRSVEVLVVILLSVATVTTAWSAYQATRWSGTQAINSGQADALRAESTKWSDRANSLSIVDVQLFTAWVAATGDDDTVRSDFLRERFRDEFRPAFDAWLASVPDSRKTIPEGTPFDRPEYQLAARAESERLSEEAADHVAASREANQRGDNFILVTVLFASVLFFAGTVGKLRSRNIRRMLLVLASVVWVGGVTIMLILPQNVGF
jgi:hypothetical protein